jgi:hypothetical protein
MNQREKPAALLRFLHPAPDFLIIGAQKGGTTSLHQQLCAHPQVLSSRDKEIHYFDNQHHRGATWYLRQFPSRPRQLLRWLHTGAKPVCGEATPMYLFHPLAPARIARLLPKVRLVALLRDPVYRAYSHYQHNLREGWETLSFEEALDREEDRTLPALAGLRTDPDRLDTRLHAYSYCARGRYLEQLRRYEALFPAENLLVLSSEDYFARPQQTYQQVLAFLGLAPFTVPVASANRGNYGDASLSPAVAERLRRYFEPHNEALFGHLGRRFSWG